MEMESSCKRGKAPAGGCVVDGCEADLSVCREYHRRHKVCEAHSKTPKVSIAGREQRFCQQCSRFHSLLEFDDGKRSCRKRLDGHNRRRRKHPHPHPQPPHQNSTTHFDELGGGGTLLVSFNNNNNNNNSSSFWRIPDHDDNNLLYTTPTTHLHHHQHHNYYTNNNAESSTHISNSSSIFQNDAAALSLLSLEAPPPPPNQLHYSTSATRTFTWDH